VPEGIASAVGQILAIALIVYVSRYLLRTDEGESPKERANALYFYVRRKLRFAGVTTALFFSCVLVASWHVVVEEGVYVILPIALFLICVGTWLASGLVTIDAKGITKRVVGITRSFRWDEITEVRFEQKHNTIRLQAGSRKMTIDGRFVASKILLEEISRRTGLDPQMA
jgi:hypothetical protein